MCVSVKVDGSRWGLGGGLEDCKIRSFMTISLEVKRSPLSLRHAILLQSSDMIRHTPVVV